jgi:KTSC domain
LISHTKGSDTNAMDFKKLSGGNLQKAGFDAAQGILEIHFVDGKIKRFKAVQPEVFRRLVASPNPATFYEDRIVEEYPVEQSRSTSTEGAKSKLDDLFG